MDNAYYSVWNSKYLIMLDTVFTKEMICLTGLLGVAPEKVTGN